MYGSQSPHAPSSGLLLPNGQPAGPQTLEPHASATPLEAPEADRHEGPGETVGLDPGTTHPALTSDTQMVALGSRRGLFGGPSDSELPETPAPNGGSSRGWTDNQPGYADVDPDRAPTGHRNGDLPRHGPAQAPPAQLPASQLPSRPSSRPVSSLPMPVDRPRLDDLPGESGADRAGTRPRPKAAARVPTPTDAHAIETQPQATRRSADPDDVRPAGGRRPEPTGRRPEPTGRRPEPTGRRPEPAEAAGEPPMRPGDVEQSPITFWADATTRQFHDEWHEVKAQFVDDPVAALTRAHDLLTEAVHELTESLLAERDDLDPLRRTSTPDTETMRMAMRGYHEFLDRILAL